MDLDLHGVNLRLLDAYPQDVRLVQRQLPGMASSAGPAQPGVVVRFVDSLVMEGKVSRFGADLVDDKGVVLVCERHVREVPLLVPLVRMAALDQGILALHAVAFTHGGMGIAATGWSGSGKTALLLAMLAAGAEPVAAEWVLVSRDGRQLLGVPQAVRLKPTHVDRWTELARLTREAGGAKGRLLSAIRPMAVRVAPSTKPLIERALKVDVPMNMIGKQARRARGSAGQLPTAPFDVLLLLEDAEVGEWSMERVGASFATERIAAGLQQDLAELHATRRLLNYASGRPVDGPLDSADAAHRQLLARHLATRPVFLLRHCQPTPFETLRAAIEREIA